MNNTFDTVDEKVAETEFFLRKMTEVRFNFFEFQCYLSAYLSASRTTTLALQRFKDIPGFDQWYEPHRKKLQANNLAKFFHNLRNDHAHGGPYPISGGSMNQGKSHFYFSKSDEANQTLPEEIVPACRDYFILLLEVVYDCYVKLGVYVDPQQHYTKEHFSTQGQNIDDAELEVFGWICTSLIEDGFDEDDRWHELRGHVDECKINHLFYSYLGNPTPQPMEPEHYEDFDFTPDEKGWVHIPAGFASLEDYLEFIRKSRNENKE